MAGRKLLYMLRRPLAAGQADPLLPGGGSPSREDDVSIVLLEEATHERAPVPGRTFVLQDNHDVVADRSDVTVISYADLVRMVIEADSTIVI
ncbi:MAG TPA: hypothetical protein VHF07_02750 [Nitrospiraceae bacterium]|nr:hypothetical protein [Nitrospiraceae bacterium]